MTDLNKALLRVARGIGLDDVYQMPSASTWLEFVAALSDAFEGLEREREQMQRSLELSSQEMRQLADQIRNEKDVLTAVLAALSNGVVHLDRSGRVRYANRAFRSMFSIEDDPTGRNISELVIIENHQRQSVDTVDVVHKLERGAIWRDEECSVRRGTTKFAASVVISPVFDQGATERLGGYVISIADATERQRSAARVRAAEVEVASAEQARQAQASFLANMSHELRTPLNAIIGYSELVAEEAEDLGYTEILPDLDKIQRSGRHLVGLISDVLDMSKIQAGKLEFELEEIDLGAVARDAYEATYPLAVNNGNAFEIEIEDPLPTVEVDSIRVMQAFVNLIGNAGKFTENGTITLRVYSRAGTQVVGEVEDTGIGIPKAKLADLFSPFTQADSSTTRRFGGTGLGLAITREVIDAMRGKIEVESVEGEGSVFRIVLPAAGVSEVFTGIVPDPTPGPTRTVESLLVIDDDRATHALIRRHLAETDIVIHSSFSAEEGFKKAKEIEPELLFLDILLPGIDGWALLDHWRSHPRLSQIPFYILSVVNDRPRATREGARGFLNKPIEGDDILDAVTVRDVDSAEGDA